MRAQADEDEGEYPLEQMHTPERRRMAFHKAQDMARSGVSLRDTASAVSQEFNVTFKKDCVAAAKLKGLPKWALSSSVLSLALVLVRAVALALGALPLLGNAGLGNMHQK